MSLLQVGLALSLVRESFGEQVETVSSYLLHHGRVLLRDIVSNSQLTSDQVKRSLCVLVQHGLVGFQAKPGSSHMLYHLELERALWLVRYPRCIHTGKVLFGDAGELIIEDLLQQGHALMSQCVQRVSERLEENLGDSGADSATVGKIVKKQFVALVEARFLQRVSPCNNELGLELADDQGKKFDLPPNYADAIVYTARKRGREDDESEQPQAKRRKGSTEEVEPDAGIVWCVNFQRLHQYFRDQAIVEAVGERLDSSAGCVMRALLSIVSSHDNTSPSQFSSEVYAHQVSDALGSKPKLSLEQVEKYLKAICEDEVARLHCVTSHVVPPQTSLLCRTSIGGGGQYKVDYKQACDVLCRTSIELVVRERFGTKAYRIFRLLLSKKILEQQQVADSAMLPSKEAKEILYTLLAENFVSLQEVPRTPDYAPSRTFYLFTINIQHVARMVLERCYQAINNLIVRRVAETSDNKRLLDKYQQFEAQGEVEDSEVEEILTPEEKKKAETVRASINRIEHAEIQVDETVFLISNYLKINQTHGK